MSSRTKANPEALLWDEMLTLRRWHEIELKTARMFRDMYSSQPNLAGHTKLAAYWDGTARTHQQSLDRIAVTVHAYVCSCAEEEEPVV